MPASAVAARSMLAQLSDFCRLMLRRSGDGDFTTVGEEMGQLRAYLALQRSRWADLLDVDIDCPAELEAEPLPHFLLLPLVENAIKYGQATSVDRIGVSLRVRREPAALVFTVANTGAWIESGPDRPEVPSLGIGLANLRERLERYYPRRHQLDIRSEGGWVTVTLRILPASSPPLPDY